MSEELKPCPFCGGDAEFERIGNSRRSTIVNCTECGASQECGEEWGHGRTWNTRHIPEGYALVPVEPTSKMKQTGGEHNYAGINLTTACDYAYEVYRAMIAAARDSQE